MGKPGIQCEKKKNLSHSHQSKTHFVRFITIADLSHWEATFYGCLANREKNEKCMHYKNIGVISNFLRNG